MYVNKLTVNYDKTCYMIFTPSHSNVGNLDLDLYVKKFKITRVASTKYLGIIIDENLDWKSHIYNVCQELRKFIGIFYKLSFKLPLDILRTLYFALIFPRLLYAVEIYANTYLTYLHDLIILNNRLLRILQRKPRQTSSIDLYACYNTLPVNKLFQFQMLRHAYKLLFCPDLLPSVFINVALTNTAVHSHDTRSKLDFHRLPFNSPIGSKVSNKICARLWNSLPVTLKEIKSVHLFERGIKMFLLLNDLN